MSSKPGKKKKKKSKLEDILSHKDVDIGVGMGSDSAMDVVPTMGGIDQYGSDTPPPGGM